MDIQQGGIEFHICICIIKSRTFLVTAVFFTWDSDHAGTVDPFWSEGWSPPPCTPLPNWAINGSIKMARVRFLLVARCSSCRTTKFDSLPMSFTWTMQFCLPLGMKSPRKMKAWLHDQKRARILILFPSGRWNSRWWKNLSSFKTKTRKRRTKIKSSSNTRLKS